LPWAVAAIAGLAALVLGILYFGPHPAPPSNVVRFQFPAPEEAGVGVPVVSPDGTKAIVWSSTQLWARSFDSLEPRPLAKTEGIFVETPFWTADSRFVVYAAGGMLKKVDVSGGPPVSLCELPGVLWGGFTLDDGRILFASVPGGFFVVSPTGGTASRLEVPGMEKKLGQYPMPLPDGKHFIFNSSGVTGAGTPGIYVASLDGREKVRRLLPDPSRAAYVRSQASDSGYLLFQRDHTLMAQPFNAKKLEMTGDPVCIATQTGRSVAATGFSASARGALIYRTGPSQSKLTWFDRQGKQLGTAWAPCPYTELSISPDGSRVAVVRNDNPPATWIHEFATESSTRLIPRGAAVKPIWSPDNRNLVFAGAPNAGGLYESSANGAGEARLLVSMRPDLTKWAWDWSPDGRWLLFSIADRMTKEDLWVLPTQGEGRPQPYLATDYTETDAAFSPDGRFVAYVSDESGKFEVYVRPFPSAGGGKWLISSGGGYQPRWRRDGKELFFFAAEGKLMSVDVTSGAPFQAGTPKFLFQASIFGGGATTDNHYWDAAPDGKGFLVNVIDGGSAPATVVLNWQAGLGK
jgi:Tol biopolymer transport system component